MSNSDAIELEGIVVDVLGGGKYAVKINDMDLEIEAYAAGKMKKYNIRIIPGDLVKVQLSPYEPTKGRIVYRSINKKGGGNMPARASDNEQGAANSTDDTVTPTSNSEDKE